MRIMHTIYFSASVAACRPSGEIGRRARLKIEWGNPPSRFESGEGHISPRGVTAGRLFPCGAGGARVSVPPACPPGTRMYNLLISLAVGLAVAPAIRLGTGSAGWRSIVPGLRGRPPPTSSSRGAPGSGSRRLFEAMQREVQAQKLRPRGPDARAAGSRSRRGSSWSPPSSTRTSGSCTTWKGLRRRAPPPREELLAATGSRAGMLAVAR